VGEDGRTEYEQSRLSALGVGKFKGLKVEGLKG